MNTMPSTRYHNYLQDNAVCFWTSAIISRVPVFRSRTAARAVLAIWDECRVRCNVRLVGYVIMPDHIHVAFWAEHAEDAMRFLRQSLGMISARIAALAEQAGGRDPTVATWLRMFKAHAGDGQQVRVWKERGRGYPVTDMETLLQKLNYMHCNPVQAKLARVPEEWEFSSAAWYTSGTGPLRLDDVPL